MWLWPLLTLKCPERENFCLKEWMNISLTWSMRQIDESERSPFRHLWESALTTKAEWRKAAFWSFDKTKQNIYFLMSDKNPEFSDHLFRFVFPQHNPSSVLHTAEQQQPQKYLCDRVIHSVAWKLHTILYTHMRKYKNRETYADILSSPGVFLLTETHI